MADDAVWTWEHVQVEEVRLRCAFLGEGPPVVLLHGFPDLAWSWRFQMPALAAAGFRAVAPDLRGYGGSDRPPSPGSYGILSLVGDVRGLIQSLGAGPVTLVGHDWGGIIAWMTAAIHPELVRGLVVLNAPHPRGYRHALRHSPQLLRSWYALFFQIPWIPERVLRAFDLALLTRTLRRSVLREGALTDADLRIYKQALGQPGALEAALEYYRLTARWSALARAITYRSKVRTLVIWGERDPFLDVKNLESLDRWIPDLQVARMAEAGHWVHWDAPECVNERLIAFAGAAGDGDRKG